MAIFPISVNERERMEAVYGYGILDSPKEAEFDRITSLASLICGKPISLISIVDEERQWFKSVLGLEVRETARELAFCGHTIMDKNLFEITDAEKDERFSANDLVTGAPFIRFYAGFPLIDPKGFALGTLCVIDHKPGHLSTDQRKALELLAREVVAKIVERRQKEELRNFEKLFHLSGDLLCVAGLDGYFKKINPSFQKLLGQDIDQLLDTPFNALLHPDDHEKSRLQLARLRKGENSISYISRLRTSKGTYKTLQWTATAELSTGFIFAIGRDITEKHQLESELQRTRDMLEQTSSVAHVGGWEVDLHAGKVLWTAMTCKIHGESPDYEPDLHTSIDFYKEGESREKIREAVHLAITKGIPYDLELQIINKQGREVWVRSIGNAEFKNGICQRIYGTIQDIDEKTRAGLERVKSRKLLDEVLRAASAVSIIAIDRSGIINVFNTGAENILGYEAAEMVGSHSMTMLHRPDEMAIRKEQLALEYGHPIDDLQLFTLKPERDGSEEREWTYIRKEGTERTVSLVTTAIRDTNGQINGYLGIATDITERKQMENALKAAKQQAEKASQAKSEFLANMSHEIRTPLNGVIGFTDLVMKTSLSGIQRQYISIVNQSANALLGIINDILDFSKIEAGKMELSIEKCDTYQICTEATGIISYQVQQKGLAMRLAIEPDLPKYIWVDHVRLKQILVNLLGNAAKFTEKGEIGLSIEVLATQGAERTIRFGVRDTGIGIKKEKQDTIFDAFSQADGSTTKKYGGTGLGLTISNRLLALMGSRLMLQSEPGQGSFFYFDISMQTEGQNAQTARHTDSPGSRKQQVVTARPLTIIIAEDNEINMLLSTQIVRRLAPNATVLEAVNGLEAVRYCEQHKPDLIFMDMQMPELSGYEATIKIRENQQHRQIPIIALTAGSLKGEREKCLAAGMDDYVIKPVIEETLAAIFKKWIPALQ